MGLYKAITDRLAPPSTPEQEARLRQYTQKTYEEMMKKVKPREREDNSTVSTRRARGRRFDADAREQQRMLPDGKFLTGKPPKFGLDPLPDVPDARKRKKDK